ncbi:nuclear control of ATPase protein 2 [Penicillium ochrochloron]
MSIVQETACGVNTQLDRLQQQITRPEKLLYTEDAPPVHVRRLQNVIGSISVTSKTQPFLSATRLADLLADPTLTRKLPASTELQNETESQAEEHVSDYLWLVAAKASVQASGLVMHSLLDQTLRLQEETYYWNDVLGSVWNSGLYTAQTAPTRLWHWTKGLPSIRNASSASLSRSLAARWAQFYQIARQSMSESPLRLNWSSPIRSCRAEARQKRDRLVAMTDIHTSSLGLLMESWHAFLTEDVAVDGAQLSRTQWQETVSRIVILTETILHQAINQSNVVGFEERVVTTLKEDQAGMHILDNGLYSTQTPADLIQRLVSLLRDHLPAHTSSMSTFVALHGRPSRVTRYWIPVSLAILSGSASLKFLAHRQDQILQWIMDFGATIIDFGGNWVVDPIRKLIGTIRHDEKSEIAIMSKNSLVADRASLERMVIDFVRDRPDSSQGQLPVEDTTAIANAVKEGDLTPVLKAYERDLRTPFVGTVRGDLVRALLIQIQKTKVDVEIAISGIDALLKSQELVFGFVGLTPGILVSYASLRWLIGLFGNRRGLQRGKKRHQLRRGLRNVTRIVTSVRSSDGTMSYKESGRLICEAEALLQRVRLVLGGIQYQEFREDVQDLLDVQSGVEKQLRVVERMRWAYFQ